MKKQYYILIGIILVIILVLVYFRALKPTTKVTDKLITKDNEICSPSSEDGTPYCLGPEVMNHPEDPRYSIIYGKCPDPEGSEPVVVVIYDTRDETMPPSGKARIAHYCPSINKFLVFDYDSEKIPMPYWYGPFDGYPVK